MLSLNPLFTSEQGRCAEASSSVSFSFFSYQIILDSDVTFLDVHLMHLFMQIIPCQILNDVHILVVS